MMGMPRGVTHSTAKPDRAMSRALSVSQRCRDGSRLRVGPSGKSHWGAGRRGTYLDGPSAREHFLETVEHLAHKVVGGLPHELLGMQGTQWGSLEGEAASMPTPQPRGR